jgi:hypothetical protein
MLGTQSRKLFKQLCATRCRQHDPILISESGPPSFSAFRVVNDKGRYRQQPESPALETFKRSHLRPRSRVDHSLHPEVFVCSRCSAQLFGQKRGQAETKSVPVRLLNRGTGGHKCGEGRVAPGCLCRLVRHTASPRTRLRLPSHLRVAPFLPSEPA